MPMKRAIEVVRALAPQALDNYVKGFDRGDQLLDAYGINTPIRLSHFLAQVLHETGGLRIARESMRYSRDRLLEIFGAKHSARVTPEEAARLEYKEWDIAERVYGTGNPVKARELGNTKRGDGYLYRGNGLMQTTGRFNHRLAGRHFDVDFEGRPELLMIPEHVLKGALYEWSEIRGNMLADADDIRGITRKINGGYVGLDDRQRWFDRVSRFLDVGQESGVFWLQASLNTLGATPPLAVDGIYGPKTRGAVRRFQMEEGLVVDGIADDDTKNAIRRRLSLLAQV